MRGFPIVALATAAVIVGALTTVTAHAMTDPAPTVVAADLPLAVPASYQPKHFLTIPTKGPGGVTLVRPTQPITLDESVISSAASVAGLGKLTGEDQSKAVAAAIAAKPKPAPAAVSHTAPAPARHDPVVVAHPKAPVPKAPAAPPAPAPSHDGMTLLQWIAYELAHHHHGDHDN